MLKQKPSNDTAYLTPVLIFLCFLHLGRYSYQILALNTFAEYTYIFNHIPEPLLQMRYLVSYVYRYVGILLGIGLLMGGSIFRKGIIWFNVFVITTSFFKHPYQVILRDAERLHIPFPFPGNFFMSLNLPIEQLAWCWVSFFTGVDIFASVIGIWYLTRPVVKSRFERTVVS